jgi:dihydropteroate synthase
VSAQQILDLLAAGEKTLIMAIINATPDSFSGDGVAGKIEEAVRKAIIAEEDGADLIDIGAESTRPGHVPLSAGEEIDRLIPILEAVRVATSLPISVDTSKARVADAAFRAGATIVNDIRGFTADPDLARFTAETGAPAILMHDIPPLGHGDFVTSIIRELSDRIDAAIEAGVASEKLIVDPGFGFGKDWRQNLELLNRLDELQVLGKPILVGFSRKSTVGRVLGLPPEERLEGTIATTALAIAKGAAIVRVHDVKANVRAARMTDAVVRAIPAEAKSWPGGPPA